MKQGIGIAPLCAALFALVMLAGISQTAKAQQNFNCCTWSINALGIPDACFPITVTTKWNGGFGSFTIPLEAGIYPNQPLITTSPCPPAPAFIGATIDGGITFATPGNPVVSQVNGCCIKVDAGFDVNGCVEITLTYC